MTTPKYDDEPICIACVVDFLDAGNAVEDLVDDEIPHIMLNPIEEQPNKFKNCFAHLHRKQTEDYERAVSKIKQWLSPLVLRITQVKALASQGE